MFELILQKFYQAKNTYKKITTVSPKRQTTIGGF